MTDGDLARALHDLGLLVLDIDDTIVDTRFAMTEAGTLAAQALWPDRPESHREMAVRYFQDPGGWFRRYAAGEISIEQMRIERLREVAAAFAVDLPADAQARYLDAYAPAFRRSQRLFDDVPALLAAADAAAVPLALLTNSTAVDTAVKLDALGLRARFEGVVVTTDTLGFGKPDPRVYLEACLLVGAEPARAVCVGDNLEWDVVGAIAAGMRGIWLDREGVGPVDGHVRVEGLAAITEVLARRSAPDPGANPSRFGAGAVDR